MTIYLRPDYTEVNVNFTDEHYDWLPSSSNEVSFGYLEIQGLTLNGSTLNGGSCLNGPNFYAISTVTDNVTFNQIVGEYSVVTNNITFRQIVNLSYTSTEGNNVVFRQNVISTGPGDFQVTFRQRVYA